MGKGGGVKRGRGLRRRGGGGEEKKMEKGDGEGGVGVERGRGCARRGGEGMYLYCLNVFVDCLFYFCRCIVFCESTRKNTNYTSQSGS